MYEALRYGNIGAHSLTGTNVAGSFADAGTWQRRMRREEEVEVEAEAETEGGSSGWYNRAKPTPEVFRNKAIVAQWRS